MNSNFNIEPMILNDNVIKTFHVKRIFHENTDRIKRLSYSMTGDTLITSGDDDSIVIYDCLNGSMKKSLNSKKYGVDLIHFTHTNDTVIHSSTKIDDTIRFLSLEDNKYIRYFPGHVQKVTSLSMSPIDDIFLSGSLDKTVRIWDLKSTNCTGLIHCNGGLIADFDPEGLIFAIGITSDIVKLYDLRSFDKGCFNTFSLSGEKNCEWTGLKFSPDGRLIMITTNGNMIHLVDSFTGQLKSTLTGFVNNKRLPIEASFSPDANYIFSGSSDGRIHSWNVDKNTRICSLLTDLQYGQTNVSMNPKYTLLASYSNQLMFWLPNHEEI